MFRFAVLAVLLLSVIALAAPALPNAVAQSSSSFRFVVVGDTGTGGSAQYAVAKTIESTWKRMSFPMCIMVGDNLYGSEAPKDFVSKFERPYQTLIRGGVKFYASLGNHDDAALQKRYQPFNMGGERYYSFRPAKGVRFFALDSNYMDKQQRDWLVKQLAESGSDWKILFFHHPIYSSGEKHGSNVELRSVLEPLIVKYGVDAVFTGHEHFYERLKPQKGVQYFIVGSSAKLREGNIAKTELTAKGFDQDNVFLVAEIVGEEMRFQTITRTGKVVDSGSFRRAEKSRTAGR